MSLSLLHKLLIFIVFCALVSSMTSILFGTDAKWQETAFWSLQNKLSVAVNNAHWQWQKEGRPADIVMQQIQGVEPGINPYRQKMTRNGWPKIAQSDEACLAFLSRFTQPLSPQASLSVSATFKSDGDDVDSNLTAPRCVYKHPKHGIFEYNLTTGAVTVVFRSPAT